MLLDYRKANKERRLNIIVKAGFSTEKEYLDYLMKPEDVLSSEPEGNPVIHNVHIIDISGSMSGGKIAAAIQGINGEIEALKTDPNADYIQTIVEFSSKDNIRTVVDCVPLKNITTKYFAHANGGTALNQTVGETLVRMRGIRKPNEKVLVKIFTDGGENDSVGPYKDYRVLSDLIKECEQEGFTITFVGTERDVQHVVHMMNIDASNTLSHDNTARGMGETFTASLMATRSYSQAVKAKKAVTKGFYKKLKDN